MVLTVARVLQFQFGSPHQATTTGEIIDSAAVMTFTVNAVLFVIWPFRQRGYELNFSIWMFSGKPFSLLFELQRTTLVRALPIISGRELRVNVAF
jgi:hypothetical protein